MKMRSTGTGTSLVARATVTFSILVIIALPQQISNSTLLIKLAVLDRCQPDFVTVSGPQCQRPERRLSRRERFEVTANSQLYRQPDRHYPKSAVKHVCNGSFKRLTSNSGSTFSIYRGIYDCSSVSG